jgi:hypothetical protein
MSGARLKLEMTATLRELTWRPPAFLLRGMPFTALNPIALLSPLSEAPERETSATDAPSPAGAPSDRERRTPWPNWRRSPPRAPKRWSRSSAQPIGWTPRRAEANPVWRWS